MVWYPSVDDVVCANNIAIDLGNDRHPPKLLGSRKGIQAIIDRVKEAENRGLMYQAALLMKEIARLHAFAGANHRTAYLVVKTFLFMNGKKLRVNRLGEAYPFIKNIDSRSIEEIREWVEHGV